LDENHRVYVSRHTVRDSTWSLKHIAPYHGQKIANGEIPPSDEALLYHWERIGLTPDFDEEIA